MQPISSKLPSDIQFFLDLKILILKNISLNNCLAEGIISSPSLFAHPYEGSSNIFSIKAIKQPGYLVSTGIRMVQITEIFLSKIMLTAVEVPKPWLLI
jgi:hypothetical protein